MIKTKHNDFPLQEVCDQLNRYAKQYPNLQFFQKFSCEHCGSRQTMAEANKLYASGVCEECGKSTDIKARGCNYMLII